MKTLAEIRSEFPQYKDMTDRQLGDALYNKFYSDMDKTEFESLIGLSAETDKRPSFASGLGSAALQGFTFGFSDEAIAAGRAAFGDVSYEEAVKEERQKLKEFSDENMEIALAAELIGSLPTAIAGPAGLAKIGATAGKLGSRFMAGRAAPQAASNISSALARVGERAAPIAERVGKRVPSPLSETGKRIAPTVATAGAEGAIYGAGTAESGLEETLRGAALGGLLGAGGGAVIGTALPKVTGAAQQLISEGVPLTPAQATGGGISLPSLVEGVLDVMPFTKQATKEARQEAVAGFGRAAINRALEPIGGTVSKRASGFDAFDEAFSVIDESYDKALSKINIEEPEKLREGVEVAIARAVDNQPTLTGDELKKFNEVNSKLFNKLPLSGKVDSRIIKKIESDLGRAVRSMRSKGNNDVASALQDVQADFRLLLAQQDDSGSKLLQNANAAFKNMLPIQKAVNRARQGGQFTPQQYMQALRSMSPRPAAKGRVEGQDLATAAQEIFSTGGEGTLAAPLMAANLLSDAVIRKDVGPLGRQLALSAVTSPLYSSALLPFTRKTYGLLGEAGQVSLPFAAGAGAGLLGQE